MRDGEKLTLSAVLKEPQRKEKQVVTLHPALSGATLANLDNNNGVQITQIRQGSMAEQYGLQVSDIIIGINRTQINNLEALQRMIKSSPALVALNIKRGDQHLFLILD